MLSRRIFPFVGRSLVAGAAVVAVAGLSNCATFARDESLDGTVASKALGSRARATLDAIMNGSPGTYIGRLLADRDSTLERWPDRVSDPLKVWIDSSSTVSGEQAGFPAANRPGPLGRAIELRAFGAPNGQIPNWRDGENRSKKSGLRGGIAR